MGKVLAALTGVSVWVSMATLMVTDDRTLARSAAFPPLWLLFGLVMAGAAIARLTNLSVSRTLPLSISFLLWLPFLPFRIPAIFVVWAGPLKWAVWSAVIFGLWWQRNGSRESGVGSRAPGVGRWPVRAAIITAVAATAGFISLQGNIPGGDEPHYLIITQSLLKDGDLLIENNHKQGDYRAYLKQDIRPDYIVRGKDQQIYSIHPPGVAVLTIPGFAVAGYYGAAATIILCAAAAALLSWMAAWWLTASASAAWFAWASVFITTPFFFHEFTIYPDGAGALLALIAVIVLLRMELKMPAGPQWLVSAGLALSLLPWFHTRFAVLAASAGLVLIARLATAPDAFRKLATFLAVPVISAAAWFGYFWLIYGTPNPAVQYGAVIETTFSNISRGAPGLLLDQQFGLISNAPVYALALFGWILLAKRRLRFAIELAAIAVPYFLATAAYHMWWGGVSPPARFIASLMPIAVLPLAWWWHERDKAAVRALSLTLLMLSVAAMLARAFVDRGVMVFNDRDGFDLLLQWASDHVDLPLAFPGLHRGPEGFMLTEALVWAIAGMLLVVAAKLIAKTKLQSRGAAWTAVAWIAAVLAMASATTVWAMNGVAGVTANRSQVAALHQWRPEWQTTSLRLQPFRSLTTEEFERQIEIGSTDRVSRWGPDNPTIFRVSWLPAGTYDIVASGDRTLNGELFLWAGKTELITERWRLDGKQPGFTGYTLDVPVPLYNATFRGDPEAKASVSAITLRLKDIGTSPFGRDRFAERGTRYGATRAFFMDDHSYMEPGGFWTRGESDTAVFIDVAADAPAPVMWIQSGPVATSVQLKIGDWRTAISLNPQERKNVELPASAEKRWALEIHSGPAFRPSEISPGNGDDRPLGVWIEFR